MLLSLMDPLIYLIPYLKILLIVLFNFICALLNFISVAELLLIALHNLVFCLVVNNNSCGVSFLLKFLIPNRNVAPSLDLTAFLIYLIVHLLTCNLFRYIQPLFISSMNYLIYFKQFLCKIQNN